MGDRCIYGDISAVYHYLWCHEYDTAWDRIDAFDFRYPSWIQVCAKLFQCRYRLCERCFRYLDHCRDRLATIFPIWKQTRHWKSLLISATSQVTRYDIDIKTKSETRIGDLRPISAVFRTALTSTEYRVRIPLQDRWRITKHPNSSNQIKCADAD